MKRQSKHVMVCAFAPLHCATKLFPTIQGILSLSPHLCDATDSVLKVRTELSTDLFVYIMLTGSQPETQPSSFQAKG